ncbi:MAG: hypothetical protein NDJ92_08500 [Thermoanaerobaculia bacterium]|nr:hypothetical protein [Thermoanaerobaculia bacterium]
MQSASEMESTSIHEAGHAVIGYVLGVQLAFVQVKAEGEGVAMPLQGECLVCSEPVAPNLACISCSEYFVQRPVRNDERISAIDKQYRQEAAIAVAGELAEREWRGRRSVVSMDELRADRLRARSLLAARHRRKLRRGEKCLYEQLDETCVVCASEESNLRANVLSKLTHPQRWQAIEALAGRLLTTRSKIDGSEVLELLAARGLSFAEIDLDEILPPCG